jgi:hypothetical protein
MEMNELSKSRGPAKRITDLSPILFMFICIAIALSACGNDDNDGLAAHNVEIFVANLYGNTLTSYRGTDNGDVAPQSTIDIQDQPMGVAVDTVNNEIFAISLATE